MRKNKVKSPCEKINKHKLSAFMKTLFSICNFLILLTISFLSFSQTPINYIEGDIMVRIEPDQDIRQIVAEINRENNFETNLQVAELVSDRLDIWLLKFDKEKVAHQSMLEAAWRNKNVLVAQNNHIIKYRDTTPDDALFGSQWQYINDGNPGTPDGDIDAELAWDITTGGTTVHGDEIVVCVIDDALDYEHEDFGDNHWVNTEEIPDNGMDDDGNGYVDDYLGWNTASNNDNIEISGFAIHGTSVSGIIGAQGNNGIGVAGVNWDVKIMFVSGGSGQESEVLQAYGYPLEARITYNESNGERGAFVVATNASWGVNFGQPSAAPLWCAFYDTLGAHGILNAGATINGNQNVDVVGDLPTACPSDYMISVTNMNINDEKVTGAGYGATTIDLGAHGEGTYTISYYDGGIYGTFGGTSGATPHVSGAIALLYSAPCSGLIEFSKSDPAGAALLVRQYILEGVDPNASLEGITTTGGRLNLFNSLNLVMGNCSESSCGNPYSFEETNVIDVEASFAWTTYEPPLGFNVQLVNAGDTSEITYVEDPAITYDGLTACTDYELLVQAICDTAVSNLVSYPFQTDGCCEPPVEFSVSDVTDVGGTVGWNSVLAAVSYNIQVSPLGTNEWTEFTGITENQFIFTALDACSNYEFQVQTVCEGMVLTDYSESTPFAVAGCGNCVDLSYCDAGGNDFSFEWISQVSLNTINNVTTGDGYALYETNTTDLLKGCTYPIEIGLDFGGNIYEENFGVWIDFDQSGDFSDSEKVFEFTASSSVSGDIMIPLDAVEGSTRMRVGLFYQVPPEPCAEYDYGEVEDYCVNIINGSGEGGISSVNAGDDVIVCVGDEIQLNGMVEGDALTYTWSPNTGLSNANIPNPIFSASSSIVYTLTVTGESECGNISVSDEIVITVEGNYTINASDDISICTEGMTEISVNEIEGASYSWSPADGLSDVNASVTNASPLSTTTYTVTAEIGGQCPTTITDEVTITVEELPIAEIMMETTDCENNTIVLSTTATGENLEYTWTTEDGNILEGNDSESINVDAMGEYTLSITNTNVPDCSTETSLVITALPAIEAFEFESNVEYLDAPEGFESYQWLLNGEAINGANEAAYIAVEDGEYSVTVTNTAGCEWTTEAQSIVITSLENNPIFNLQLYPNPASEKLTIETQEAIENLEIINILGQVIWSQNKVNNRQTIDITDYPNGIYYLKINTQAQERVEAFIISH